MKSRYKDERIKINSVYISSNKRGRKEDDFSFDCEIVKEMTKGNKRGIRSLRGQFIISTRNVYIICMDEQDTLYTKLL